MEINLDAFSRSCYLGFMLGSCVSNCIKQGVVVLVCFGGVLDISHAEETATTVEEVEVVQSAEALTLDDQLSKEMDDYCSRFDKFRRTLRQKHPKGEDRIAALEKWEKDHKAWSDDWNRRKKRLDIMWNWAPEGKPKAPERRVDQPTASGQAAAIRRIGMEEKGTEKAAEKIELWLRNNRQTLDQAKAESPVRPVPVDTRASNLPEEEKALHDARRELQRIRKNLIGMGFDILKAAMSDPNSEYSLQKATVREKAEELSNRIENRKSMN